MRVLWGDLRGGELLQRLNRVLCIGHRENAGPAVPTEVEMTEVGNLQVRFASLCAA